jgi:hypothetical protein
LNNQEFEPVLSLRAGEWIRTLGLISHPEGGFFSEIYRSDGMINGDVLPAHGGDRPFMTSIYFMLPPGDVSRLHRLKSDEIWYHHAGGCLNIHQIDYAGRHSVFRLGSNLAAGERLQVMIRAGSWFGAVAADSEEALVGCAVAPGFDFTDFELAIPGKLLAQYPQHEEIISRLT